MQDESPDGEREGHPRKPGDLPPNPNSVEAKGEDTIPPGDWVAPGTTWGTHRYLGPHEGGKEGLPDAYRGESDADPSGEDEPWWAKLGYASFEDYLQQLEESRRLMLPSPRPINEVRDPKRGWHPALDVAFEDDLGGAAGSRRQVGIKLSAADYNDLKLAADRFGVPPTTFARMLIIRGVRSTLQSSWEESLD